MIEMLIVLYIAVLGFRAWLLLLNIASLRKNSGTVPGIFTGVIDPGQLQTISAYTRDNSALALVELLVGGIITAVFLFSGLIGMYDRWIDSLTGSFIFGGVLFALFLIFVQMILDIPFDILKHFRIEQRYGFNTMTVRLWIADFIKSLAISVVLGGVFVFSILAIIASSPTWWWLWVWAFLLVFGIFIMYVSPYVIEPLFYTFEPVKAEGLEEKIRALMARAGLKVSMVFQVDASRRSRHSNAYFTGIGRVKRIVLFDTLVQQLSQEELLAVLAHEIGHWKKKHVLKSIVLTETMAFCGLSAAYHLASWDGLPRLLGLTEASLYVKAVIIGLLGTLVIFPLTPLFSFLSRRNENEADLYAASLTGSAEDLATALIKLSKENLANLHPHPIYAWFYYSHSPIIERIRSLRTLAGKG